MCDVSFIPDTKEVLLLRGLWFVSLHQCRLSVGRLCIPLPLKATGFEMELMVVNPPPKDANGVRVSRGRSRTGLQSEIFTLIHGWPICPLEAVTRHDMSTDKTLNKDYSDLISAPFYDAADLCMPPHIYRLSVCSTLQ